MSNFYYLNQYGANSHKALDAGNNINSNNFVGAMLNYNKVSLGSVGFLFENDTTTEADTFSSFYDTYKIIVGSDILSYTNKYSNTNSMAFGDMMNSQKGGSTTFTSNFSATANDFQYRLTKDGAPYRYTENGTGIALKDVTGDTKSDFTDLEVAYQTYYDYKINQFNQKPADLATVTSAVNLSTLGLDYASVRAQAGVTDANIASVYQNLVNQLTDELKTIKSGTISETDRIAMEKTLEDKQAALKSIDDALFGYTEGGTTSSTNSYYQAKFTFTGQTPAASVETASKSGTTNAYSFSEASSVASNSGFTTYATYAALVSANPANGTYCIGSSNPWLKVIVTKNAAAPGNITTAMYAALGSITTAGGTSAAATAAFRNSVIGGITTYIKANPSAAVESMNFTPAVNPSANVQTKVFAKIFGISDPVTGDITTLAVETIAQAYGLLPDAATITKDNIIAFVNTHFASLTAADKADAIETLFAKKMQEKCTNQIADAIIASVISSDTNPEDASGSLTKTVITSTQVISDITVRDKDKNYSYGTPSINITNLKGYIQDSRSASDEDKSFLDWGSDKEGNDFPLRNASNYLRGLGATIKNADGTTLGTNDGDGNNAAVETLFAHIADGTATITDPTGTGLYTVVDGGNSYVIDTNVKPTAAGFNIADGISRADVDFINVHTARSCGQKTNDWKPFLSGWHTGEINQQKDVLAGYINIAGMSADNSMQLRHLKDPADTTALITELADSLLKGGSITTTKGSAEDKQNFAIYLSEVTSGIIEQYWIENFNKQNAEPINDYYNREIRSYLNPNATSSVIEFKFLVKDKVNPTVTKLVNFKLNFDEDPAVVNTVDNIMESQAFAKIYSKMEDRSRAEMELFEASSALDIVQNINTQEYSYRLNMLSALEKMVNGAGAGEGNANVKGKVDFSGVTRSLVEIGPGADKNPWWKEYFPWFKGFYGTLPEGATADEMFDDKGNIKASMVSQNGALVDPYIVKINDVDYVMGIDTNKDGKINGAQEVLGINDKIDTSFASLKALDLNADGTVSQDELQKGGIIFEALNTTDRLNGAQIKSDFIKSIDLASLQNADGQNGIFGTFEVQLANGKKAGAIQTFETQEYFNNLFGTYVDMSFLSKTPAAPVATKTTATPVVAAAKTASTTQDQTSTKFDMKAFLAKQYNFFSDLENTDATAEVETPVVEAPVVETPVAQVVEAPKAVVAPKMAALNINQKTLITVANQEMTVDALLEDICWKMDIEKLTPKQRYDILGSVDATKSSDVIIRKMEERLSLVKNQFSA